MSGSFKVIYSPAANTVTVARIFYGGRDIERIIQETTC